MGLSAKLPMVRQRWVKSWPAKFWWMRVTRPCQPPASISPKMGMRRAPSQIRKNCNTSLKMAESRPPSATYTATVSDDTKMLKFMSQPRTDFITRAIANMLIPDISTVMKANEKALSARVASP